MTTYPTEYLYSKEHEWVKVEDDVCVLGITHYAQEELGEVVFVEMPDVGQRQEPTAGSPGSWVFLNGEWVRIQGTSPTDAPGEDGAGEWDNVVTQRVIRVASTEADVSHGQWVETAGYAKNIVPLPARLSNSSMSMLWTRTAIHL